MRLLDCEIVNGVSKEILTFSTPLRFGFNNELTLATVLMRKTPGTQACLVIAEVHGMGIAVFSFMNDLVVHRNNPVDTVRHSSD